VVTAHSVKLAIQFVPRKIGLAVLIPREAGDSDIAAAMTQKLAQIGNTDGGIFD
jgi:hypothetical protein